MPSQTQHNDIIIIGAGAAGLMCAMRASQRGKDVRIIEHTRKIGEKIRISGGGRCNFTNLYSGPENFISQNPHFCKSALKRFTPQDFVSLVEKANIPYHEKTTHPNAKGQLFCDRKSEDIIRMFCKACENSHVQIQLNTHIHNISKTNEGFTLKTSKGIQTCRALIIATGGLSIPKIGASDFGHKIAQQFGLAIIQPYPALVPLTFEESFLKKTKELSGISLDACIYNIPIPEQKKNKINFQEGLLFTHKGLSGPSILQISSYWNKGEEIKIDLLPAYNLYQYLKKMRHEKPKQMLRTILSLLLPEKLAHLMSELSTFDQRMGDLSDKKLHLITTHIKNWTIKPNGTEGYRTAEVTRGGIDTNEISSKSFESKKIKNLYFIGEVLDVTGQLGGHNFQWAWSSGYCCAENL